MQKNDVTCLIMKSTNDKKRFIRLFAFYCYVIGVEIVRGSRQRGSIASPGRSLGRSTSSITSTSQGGGKQTCKLMMYRPMSLLFNTWLYIILYYFQIVLAIVLRYFKFIYLGEGLIELIIYNV